MSISCVTLIQTLIGNKDNNNGRVETVETMSDMRLNLGSQTFLLLDSINGQQIN